MSSAKKAKPRDPTAGSPCHDVAAVPVDGGRMALANGGRCVNDALQRCLQSDDWHRLDLAKRLHKDVAGNLVACTAVNEMIRHQLADESVAGMLASIDGTLRQTLQIVRELTEEQLPPMLTAFGLGAALQQLIKQLEGEFSGSLILHVKEDEIAPDPARRLNLFRILQMMLRYCVCDAQASRVEMTYLAAQGRLECTIDYDGDNQLWAGSCENAELTMIKARCNILGGAFHTTPSAVGNGLQIRLIVPPVSA